MARRRNQALSVRLGNERTTVGHGAIWFYKSEVIFEWPRTMLLLTSVYPRYRLVIQGDPEKMLQDQTLEKNTHFCYIPKSPINDSNEGSYCVKHFMAWSGIHLTDEIPWRTLLKVTAPPSIINVL